MSSPSKYRVPLLLLIAAVALPAIVLAATVIWDETVNGDLSNDEANPTPVTMVDEENTILGTIGGPPPAGKPGAEPSETGPSAGIDGFDDGQDSYTFEVPAGLTMEDIILVDYVPTVGNTSTGFNLFDGPDGTGTFLGSCSCTVADVGLDFLDVAGIGPLAAGTYTMGIREFGTADNVYELSHAVPGLLPVPTAPTAALVGLAALLLLGSLYRLRRRTV